MTPVHHAMNYVEITVTDMDAAQHFYGTAFCSRFTDYAPAYAGIQAPGGDSEVGGLSLGQNVEPGGPLVLLYSDDLDATVAAVKDAGGTIGEEPYPFPADGASPLSTRAGTGLAYGAQPPYRTSDKDRGAAVITDILRWPASEGDRSETAVLSYEARSSIA
jgi:predicted enzyme related to lactoylglutathione lyase